MTNEQLRDELNNATKTQKEATRIVNEALSHASSQMNRVEQEAYDHGLNDCWEMVRRIYLNGDNVLWEEDLAEIFPEIRDRYLTNILLKYTPQQALAKIRAWEEKKAEEERKKQEEAEKIQIGDVVVYNNSLGSRKGIVISVETEGFVNTYRVLDSDYKRIRLMSFEVKKTGKHVDILGALE